MSEAKLSASLQEESQKAKSTENRPITAQMLLNRGFKRPTAKAIKQGKARLMMEDVIRRAERKLEELRKKTAASLEEKAEIIADELYHKPGTLLTAAEFDEICEFSECCDENIGLTRRDCFRRPGVFTFRSIDGTCNNIINPSQGVSDTAFRRLIPAHYEDGNNELRGFRQAVDEDTAFDAPNPSARFISDFVIQDKVNRLETPFSHLLAQFGQFLDHDMDLGPELEVECEGCTFTPVCSPIRVAPTDDAFGDETINEGECLPFRRSVAVCDNPTKGSFYARDQINVLTSYIDASMVYGSNSRQGNAVRDFYNNGKLKVVPSKIEFEDDGSPRDDLPVDENEIVACPGRDDCFLCGDVRCNEQISLTIMHTLWAREHNRIAKELKVVNPFWGDERLFQETRKIVGAMIQKIVYVDYLPKVLGDEIFDMVIGPYYDYDRTVDASVPNSFATAAYRYGHSLIREFWPRIAPNFLLIDNVNLRDMFFNPPLIKESGGVSEIALGWTTVNARRMDEFLSIVLTTRLFQTATGPGMDLASLNIQRQRDHGLSLYFKYRNFCEKAFPDLTDQFGSATFENSITTAKLAQLHSNAENAELWVGGISEVRLPMSLLGPTFACIFGLTFGNARDGDSFYYERRTTFSPVQLNEIRQTLFSRVICDNTATTDIQKDAFIASTDRLNCNSGDIPRINLEAWKENRCYLRVSTPLSTLKVVGQTRIFGRGRPIAPVITSNMEETTAPECLPTVCPEGNRYRIRVFINDGFNFGLFTQRDDLEFSTTLDECRRSTNPVITFTSLAQTAEATDGNGTVPDKIIDILMDEYDKENEVASVASKANEKMVEPEQTNEDLEVELQEMLKKLH